MSESLKKGLSHQEQIKQKQPRDETTGQRPKCKKEKVKANNGTFTIK